MTFTYKTNSKGNINFFPGKFFRFIENDLVMNSYSFHKKDNVLTFSGKALSDNESSTVSKLKRRFFDYGRIWVSQGKEGFIIKIKYNYLSFLTVSVIISWIAGMITMWISRGGWIVFFKGFLIALLAVNFFAYKILKFRADRLIHPNIITVLQMVEKNDDTV